MKILIAGSPKTGTTGLLYLIANSIGGDPKLLFEPKECPSYIDDEKTDIIAKVLIPLTVKALSFKHFDKKITIVRDPRDRIVSALLYSQNNAGYLLHEKRLQIVRECLQKKESFPSKLTLKEILFSIEKASGNRNIIDEFENKVVLGRLVALEKYAKKMPEAFIYKYEDFVSGTYGSLEKYLGFPITGKAEVPNSLKRVERTKSAGDWRNWFTPADVDHYKPMLSPWLAKYGYDPDDWEINSSPVISHEHCSGYFDRLVEEFRERNTVVESENSTEKNAHTPPSGRIMRAEKGVVAGWVIGADPNVPVSVALKVKGKEMQRMVADQPRPALIEKGIHPTGKCGFAFHFGQENSLNEGTVVEVEPIDQKFKIQNSPCTVKS